MKNVTYYAMSTENFQMCGMTVLGIGNTKGEALVEAEENLGPMIATDFRSTTWHRNLVCVSRSEAIRRGWIARKAYPVWDEDLKRYHLEF
jgi:hypothetical protein